MNFFTFPLISFLTKILVLSRLTTTQPELYDKVDNESSIPQILGFSFQNLGEPCRPTDTNNYELYEEYVSLSLSQSQPLPNVTSNKKTSQDLLQEYGGGRLCHPKLVCHEPGYCECRPGFTYETEHFVSVCKVDTDYGCWHIGRYYGCGLNRNCVHWSVVNRKPKVIPGPLGQGLRELHALPFYDDTGKIVQNATNEFLCVCLPGKSCPTVTVRQVLDHFYSLAPPPSESSGTLLIGHKLVITTSVLVMNLLG